MLHLVLFPLAMNPRVCGAAAPSAWISDGSENQEQGSWLTLDGCRA